MHEFPVAEQVKKLVSCIVAYAAADEDKYSVWNEIQVRKDCQKSQNVSLFSFEAEGKGNQKADSQVGKCIYHLFYPLIKEENCENIYL